MKKISIMSIAILIFFSLASTVFAAEKNDITIHGVRTNNEAVLSNRNGFLTEINKSITKIQPHQSIDVTLTAISSKNASPATNDDTNILLPVLLILLVGVVMILMRKRAGIKILPFILIIVLNPLLTVHAETAKNSYFITSEQFSNAITKSFTFDKIISKSAGTVKMKKDNEGNVIGFTWVLNDASKEQAITYRLVLKEQVSENLLDKPLEISSAEFDFTELTTKKLAYPDVSVKLKTGQDNINTQPPVTNTSQPTTQAEPESSTLPPTTMTTTINPPD